MEKLKLKVSNGALEAKLVSAVEKIVGLEESKKLLEMKLKLVKKAKIAKNKCCLISLLGFRNQIMRG